MTNTQLMQDDNENRSYLIGRSPEGKIRNWREGDEWIAELVYLDGTQTIRDLGGSLPVFVDGVECTGRVVLRNGNVVRIGDKSWTIKSSPGPSPPLPPPPPPPPSVLAPVPHSISESLDVRQGLAISLRGVGYEVHVGTHLFVSQKKITLLRGIDLDINAGEFVGIVGPSGSGKSTLIRVLNGDYVPSGLVAYNNYDSGTFLRTSAHKMAYLPQELILHESLTGRSALNFSAKLRGRSPDKIDQVLQQVGMTERADVVIRNLSGGQKKRIALASELLNDPDALFLDEATSGLDPASEREMMVLFRQLADDGITTVCITHFPDHLTLCDRLLVVNHGVLVFDGTPQEALEHFEIRSMNEIYTVLQKRTSEYPESRNLPPVRVVSKDNKNAMTNELLDEIKYSGGQLPTLLRRYIRLFFSDKKNILFLILQTPIIAALIGFTFGDIVTGFAEQHASDWKQVAFLLLLAVVWCSSSNGVREIVKEKHIYRHERRYRLNKAAYVLSKFILLGAIGIGQAWIMQAVLRSITGMSTNDVTVLSTVTLVALAGTAIGLAISSVSKTSEQAATILPIILIAQAVYSGGLARMTGLNEAVAKVFASLFWGLDALKTALSSTLLNATFPGAPGHYQPPILGSPYSLGVDLTALAIQILVILSITYLLLTERRSR